MLAWWDASERRKRLRERLFEQDGVDPDDVIMSPALARERGLTSTVTFPRGNLAPEGSVIKSTAIDPTVVDADGVYRKTGPAASSRESSDAIAAIKGQGDRPHQARRRAGPDGTRADGRRHGRDLTRSPRRSGYLSFGKQVAVLTDARFSGVSTGACIGHVSPEALAGGPFGSVRDGDLIRIVVDRVNLSGFLDLVGAEGVEFGPVRGRRCPGRPTPYIPRSPPDPDFPTTPGSGRPCRPSAVEPGAAASSTPTRLSRPPCRIDREGDRSGRKCQDREEDLMKPRSPR